MPNNQAQEMLTLVGAPETAVRREIVLITIGVIVLIFGLALVLFAGYALMNAKSMAASVEPLSKVQGMAFNASEWEKHWVVASVTMLAVGFGLLAAGALLASSRDSGFLMLATFSLFAAVDQWLLAVFGYSAYSFERPNIVESLVFLGIVLASVIAFKARRTR